MIRFVFIQVSIALLIFCPVYMAIFLVETVKSTPKVDQHSSYLSKALTVVQERYKTMKYAVNIVFNTYDFKIYHLFSFFFVLSIMVKNHSLEHFRFQSNIEGYFRRFLLLWTGNVWHQHCVTGIFYICEFTFLFFVTRINKFQYIIIF